MIDDSKLHERDATLGCDKGYDDRGFVDGCQQRRVTPHVAQKKRSARSCRQVA
jgi:hypothetical protein